MADALQRRRQEILDAHSAAESARDLDGVIATFHHPRYEIVPTGEVFDGEEAVRGYHAENFAGIPDFTVEPIRDLPRRRRGRSRRRGSAGRTSAPTTGCRRPGATSSVQVLGIYVFEEDRLVCERVYYDLLTVLDRPRRRARPGLGARAGHDARQPPASTSARTLRA